MARRLGPTEYYKTEYHDTTPDENGFRFSADGKRLFRAPGRLKEYVATDGVEIICDGAFEGRVTYEYIDLPDTVKLIGSRAFAGCSRLKDIRLPENVTVADDAFAGCSNIDRSKIPANCWIVPPQASTPVSAHTPSPNESSSSKWGNILLAVLLICLGACALAFLVVGGIYFGVSEVTRFVSAGPVLLICMAVYFGHYNDITKENGIGCAILLAVVILVFLVGGALLLGDWLAANK